MTQAENPVTTDPVASASYVSPNQKVEEDENEKLSIESIGWLFIQKYYSTYTGEISKLFAFYDKDAALLHDEFPTGDSESSTSAKTVHLASGIDAIKKHFAAQTHVAEKNKIVVERAEFQKSVNDSILIVVCGSWKRGTSVLLQFVQTFVLKAKEKTVYDVSNDLLKFIDLSEQFRESEVLEVDVSDLINGNGSVESVNEEAKDAVQEEKKVQESTNTAAEKHVEEKQPAAEEIQPTTEAKSANSEKVEKTEEKAAAEQPEKSPESSSDKEGDDAKAEKPAPVDDKAQTPAYKPTWANLAAIEPKVPKGSATSSPTNSKSAPLPAKKSVSPAQPAQAAQATQATQAVQATNGKFKKEEWYPIYIRNIEVDDEDLRGALVKQFGDIKFFKRSNKAALCDFRNKEDQQKALEAKEIVVKNNVIMLEPRVHKPFNGKPDFRKDKKQVKKNGIKKN